ncbi:MAG TPA: cellulase family glycosylhydrolase [Acidimicrobiales bacterium]|nr:cellulase family glycosylhydrolase [Acidimicrobiales bacterium]
MSPRRGNFGRRFSHRGGASPAVRGRRRVARTAPLALMALLLAACGTASPSGHLDVRAPRKGATTTTTGGNPLSSQSTTTGIAPATLGSRGSASPSTAKGGIPQPPGVVTAATSAVSVPSGPTGAPSGSGVVVTGVGNVTTQGQAVAVTPEITFTGSKGSLGTLQGQPIEATPGTWAAIIPVVAIPPAGTAAATLQFVSANGQAIQASGAGVHEAGFPTPAVVGPLHTSGNKIVDALGHVIVLDGVNYIDMGNDATPAISQAEWAQAKAWGVNVVRIELSEEYWLSNSCTYNATYPGAVDQVVNWVTSLGMVALLNLEVTAPNTCMPGGEYPMADNPGSINFWSQVAARYKGNPLVAFDLFNEPHNITDQVWLDGGQAGTNYPPYVPYQAAGMQQMYNAVRGAGAQNLVFISGNSWGNTVPAQLVSGTNIVYAIHSYTCANNPPPNCTNSNPYDPRGILTQWVNIGHQVPLDDAEFGWPSPSDGTYNNNVISFAQSQGWGWVDFTWSYSGKWALADATAVPGVWEPAPSGMPVLAALSGTVLSGRY